jgi:transposase
MQITTIGLDLAKNVFQVHGVDAEGTVVVRRKLCRTQVREFFVGLVPCLIGMEACGTAHFWGASGEDYAAVLRESVCQARQE